MKIKRHTLENIYSHKSADLVLEAGVIGVTGRNGAGKSTLIGSIGANLTGDWRNSRGSVVKKERIVTLGEKHGKVTTVIEVRPGLELTIERDIRRGKATLSFNDGRDPIEGADSVNQVLLQELGADRSLLSEVVFVGQGQIEDLLFANDSVKDRLAAKFFGLQKSTEIEKALSDRINAIQVTATVSTGELHGRLKEARSQLLRWEAALEKEGEPDTRELVLLQGHLRDYLAAGKAQEARRDYEWSKTQLQLKLEEFQEEHATMAASVDSIPIDILQAKYKAELAKEQKQATRTEHTKTVELYSTQLEKLGACPHTQTDLDSLQKQIGTLSGQEMVEDSLQAERQKLFSCIEHGEAAVCNTCESAITPDQLDRMLELVGRGLAIKKSTEGLAGLRIRSSEMRSAVGEWSFRNHTATSRVKESRQIIDELGPDAGPGNPRKWEKNLNDYDAMRAERDRLARMITKTEGQIAALVEPTDLPAGFPADFDAQAAQARIIEIQAQVGSVVEVKQQLELAKKDIGFLTKAVESAQQVEAENLVQAQLRESLIRIRAEFHPDGAQRELVGRRIQRMEEKINEYLGMIGSVFTVHAIPNGGFNFEAIFPDKPGSIMATELSGGEKVALAISFRIASVQTFCASIGLLVLDEPTASFNNEAQLGFVKVMEQLKLISAQLGMQFIIISHSEILENSFDQLIEL